MNDVDHWVGGKRVPGTSGRYGPVFDPATGEQQGRVALASASEVDAVVASARRAAIEWGQSALSHRTEILFAFREALSSRREELAHLVSREHGKVPVDAAGEVARGLENVEYACGIPQALAGRHSQQVSDGVDVHSVQEPLGVVAGITPFNFPAMVPLWMFPNAIAAGNAFVLKPSERDPSASLLLAEMLSAAGLPDGVFNVVQGDREAVERILEHPDVAAVSFVGSTPVARSVYATATARGKRVQALGGAKNHMVVLPDADVDVAADAAVSAGFGSAGERCMAISVVVAVGGVADRLVEAIAARLPAVRVGPGSDPKSEMGPLISAEHRDRVAGYVAGAASEGAQVVVDGRRAAVPSQGFFLGPSLVDRVRPGMRVYDEEIFGPVLSVVRAASYEEAIGVVNASPWGNGSAVFTRDGGAARRFEREVQTGMVGINVPIPVPVAAYSFGGWKNSLFGDTNVYGPAGLSFYTRTKTVTARWPDPSSAQSDICFPRSR